MYETFCQTTIILKLFSILLLHRFKHPSEHNPLPFRPHPFHLSLLLVRPSQLLGLWWRGRPCPGSAADGDGRRGAAPGRHGAGRHQPARHDR